MAKVNVQVAGGSIQQKEANTLGDLKRMFARDGVKYTATINGEPEDDDSCDLNDYEFVALTEQVKGA